MSYFTMRTVACGLVIWGCAALAFAERGDNGIVKFNYQDTSKRNTLRTQREDKQKKAAEEAKKKAEDERRQKQREEWQKRREGDRNSHDSSSNSSNSRSGGHTLTSSSSGRTSGTRTAASNRSGKPGAKAATGPVTTGGSYDPTTREVTEVMLDAIKTRTVKFDPDDARDNPSVILLNAPKFDPKERKRAAGDGIAQPL